ncbi:Lcl domain-containing protein [Spirochaeta dissipatitropha]
MESARNWDISTDVELVAHWAYQIGDTGQAGGIVFYDKGEYTQGWRYLEAWTTNEDGMHAWKLSSTYTSGTVTDVGSGYDNTYTAMSGAEHPAAEVVRNATHGGYEDWFLPSLDELDLMYENLHKEDIGDFVPGDYWSSSEYDENQAWFQIFANGNQHDYSKTYGGSVRAARAF